MGARLGSAARLPPATGAAGSEQSASTGGRSADAKTEAAVASARTGGRRASAAAKSVAAVASARTGRGRPGAKIVAAVASALMGGRSTRAKSVPLAVGVSGICPHGKRKTRCREWGAGSDI